MVVSNTAESINLDDLPYTHGARYMREKECLPGTRESLIREICDALNNPSEAAPRICLLTGAAGSGKSAVAHSIAQLYDGQKRLGSSYFFSRSDAAMRRPGNLFSTIARDFADCDPQFKSALCRVVKDDRSLRTSTSLLEQVEKLIIEPSKYLDTIGPLVIVVDALDESGDRPGRQTLLHAFARIIENNFPENLRFFVTARPEDDILAALPDGMQITHTRIGDISESIVDEDIGRFIDYSLHQNTKLKSPGKKGREFLVRCSKGSFVWAHAACKLLSADNNVTGLNVDKNLELLQDNHDNLLDDLYRAILSQLFPSDDAQRRFQYVMAIVVSLEEPLSLASLSALFKKSTDVHSIIKPMGSLLDGVTDEQQAIRPLHPSFWEFLLTLHRSSTFYVDVQSQHLVFVGHALLVCMREMLRFNICDLKDSRLRNTEVPGLKDQVTKAIPPHLAYSCQYWMVYMQHADCSDELDNVTSFFKDFFPFWLEAISLLSLSCSESFDAALKTCTILKEWAKVGLTTVVNVKC